MRGHVFLCTTDVYSKGSDMTPSCIKIVAVNCRRSPLATNPGLDCYEATNHGGYQDQEAGVLLVFDSVESRDSWMRTHP